jgi:hypothetical protein
MKKIQSIVILFFLLVVACSKNTSTSTSTTTTANCSSSISFAADVSPIISANCATNSGCHGSGSTNGPGALLTYSQIYSARSSISADVSSGVMPKGSSLTAAQKTTITCWVSNGAANN